MRAEGPGPPGPGEAGANWELNGGSYEGETTGEGDQRRGGDLGAGREGRGGRVTTGAGGGSGRSRGLAVGGLAAGILP